MKHRWAALVSVLALSAFVPRVSTAQETTPEPATPPPPQQTPQSQSVQQPQASEARRTQSTGFQLGQNYPNPFNPETRIPFAIGNPPTCAEPGKLHRVTLRIYNLLAQLVAIPILQGGSGSSAGQPLQNVVLTCGQYTAYWNGNYLNTAREAASGIYLYRLEVDGRAVVKKMIVMK